MSLSKEAARAVAMIGKTGSGKSTLCNILTGSKDFKEGRGGRSLTQNCQDKTVSKGSCKLTVVDTPGTQDAVDKEKAKERLAEALKNCPDGVDAFLVVIRSDVRTSPEECKAVEEAVDIFGDECFKRVIVVFTRGAEFKNDVSVFRTELVEIRKEIPRFDALMTKFSDRWVLMDNGESCDPVVRERQVSDLLSLVDTVAKHNTQRYLKQDLETQKEKRKNAPKKKDQQMEEMRKEFEKLKQQSVEDRHKLEMKEAAHKHEMEKMLAANSLSISGIFCAVGQALGAVIVSPVVGAAKLIDKVNGIS